LLTILQNTPYTYQTVGPNAYLVFKPITGSFSGDLRTTLQNLSILAEVPIIPDANVAGQVYADIREQPLEKALEIVLAGTPYVAKGTGHYYLVADRGVMTLVDPDMRETRSIRLKFIAPERAKSLLPAAMQVYVDAAPAGPNNRGGTLTIAAPSALADRIVENLRRLDRRPRQVRLDVRVVTLEHSDLLNLRVEWGWSPVKAGRFGDATPRDNGDVTYGSTSDIQVGYTADRAFTDSLLAALDLLHKSGQADITSNSQIPAQEGRQSQLKIVTEEWFPLTATTPAPSRAELCKIETGTTLTFTPQVGDNNNITLETSVEFSDSLPRGQGSDLPVVTRRTAKNAVTIRDGGTVAMAGWTKNDAGRQGKSAREVAVFVTAHLADNSPDASLPTPESGETVIRVPPAAGASRWERPHHILLDFMLAGIRENLKLDREMAMQAFDLITPADRTTPAPMSLDELRTATVGRILHTVGERIPAERFDALVKLLKSKGFVNPVAAPHMVVKNSTPAQMHAGDMLLDTRAEILEQGKAVQVDVNLAWNPSEALAPAPGRKKDESNPRLSARSITAANRVVVPNERHAVLFLGGTAPDADHESETYCLMVKPSIVERPVRPDDGEATSTEGNTGGSSVKDGNRATETYLPVEDPNETKREVEIETRFLMLDRQLLRDMQDGLPIQVITSADDANALYKIGRRMSEDHWLPLDSNEVSLLTEVAKSYQGKMLAAPKLTVLDGEEACFMLGDEVPYTAGYDEPQEASGKPMPRQGTVRAGLQLKVTPELGPEDQVNIDGTVKLTSFYGFDEKTYKRRYTYQVPKVEESTFSFDHLLVPRGRTILFHSSNAPRSSPRQEPAALLLLITAKAIPADGPVGLSSRK